MTPFRTILLLVLTLLAVGCGPQTRRYQILVKNQTPRAIIIGLAKYDGPYEEIWATPEQLAIERSGEGDRLWGVVVPPGKTADAPPVTGQFVRGDAGWLRVYGGRPSFNQMLAISRGSPDRLDLRLLPGPNRFIIREERGRLAAVRLFTDADDEPPPGN